MMNELKSHKEKNTILDDERKKTLEPKNRSHLLLNRNTLLGNFEECLYKGRFRVENQVDGYIADIGASGTFCPSHLKCPVKMIYYAIDGGTRFTNPYVANIRLRKKGYRIPNKGKVQITLFNQHGTVIKMFLIPYDLTDMPINSQTFIRQRTLYMPNDANVNDPRAIRHWLRYSIHLKFASSKSGCIYINNDIQMIVLRKPDSDDLGGLGKYEFREWNQTPENPKYFPKL